MASPVGGHVGPGHPVGDPALAVTLGWVTGGLLLAAWLHREGHRPMCQVIRSRFGLTCLGVFLAHLARVWGRFDPFDFASSRIPQRRYP